MSDNYSATNPFAPMKSAPVDEPVIEDERPEYVEAASTQDTTDDVPNGTTKEVLDWVGDDQDRAQRALDAEEAKGEHGRKGLKRELNDKLEN